MSVYTSQTRSLPTVTYSFLSASGNNAAWEHSRYSNKECSFTSNAYHLQSFVFGSKSYFCYGDPNTPFDNFVYTVKAVVSAGDGSLILFRAGPEFQDFFRFEIHTDGTYSYFRGSSHGNGTSASINRGHNASNLLGVVAQGTDVALFCNGTILTVVVDTVSASGRIGVGAEWTLRLFVAA